MSTIGSEAGSPGACPCGEIPCGAVPHSLTRDARTMSISVSVQTIFRMFCFMFQ